MFKKIYIIFLFLIIMHCSLDIKSYIPNNKYNNKGENKDLSISFSEFENYKTSMIEYAKKNKYPDINK